MPEIVEVLTAARDQGNLVRTFEDRCQGVVLAIELCSTEVPQGPGRLAGGPGKCPFSFYIFEPKIGIIARGIQHWAEIEYGHVRIT
ncbi:hypothetical protein NKJ74_30060 [Mesorhizobium sp. M0046]|uniref:hypothetical protein n=1 Tax=Mesorhizobium sp. M0046 TaxID=2956858 RepID=UPI00333A604D